MEESLAKLIMEYKNGNKNSLERIINKMYPLINKYARKLFNLEYEDMQQEMIIAVIEAVVKIKSIHSEYECLAYIVTSVKNKYLEMTRISLELKNIDLNNNYDFILKLENNNDLFLDIEFEYDLKKSCKINSSMKKKIVEYILFQGLNDTEIAKELHISRQYVNRCKKEIFSSIKNT